jgi:hypothetical protein
VDLDRFFSFLDGRSPYMGDQPVTRQIPTQRKTQTQNKRTQTRMPRIQFEFMIPAFERAKKVHASNRAPIVIGLKCSVK